jgi:hypothetical protein
MVMDGYYGDCSDVGKLGAEYPEEVYGVLWAKPNDQPARDDDQKDQDAYEVVAFPAFPGLG